MRAADPSAQVEDCVAWDDVRVGRGARLRRVVVGDGVRVPDGFEAWDAVILQGPSDLEITPLV